MNIQQKLNKIHIKSLSKSQDLRDKLLLNKELMVLKQEVLEMLEILLEKVNNLEVCEPETNFISEDNEELLEFAKDFEIFDRTSEENIELLVKLFENMVKRFNTLCKISYDKIVPVDIN
jgi:hypothetical protein